MTRDRIAYLVLGAAAAAVVTFLVLGVANDHWIFHPLRGLGYQFWSGIAGSFIVGGGIWAGTISLIRRHNCHARWCPRPGRYPTADGKYVVCRKHHPEVPDRAPTAAAIAEDHFAARNGGA